MKPASGATPTGLEPATSAVTGRRANQLRYGALRCREAVVVVLAVLLSFSCAPEDALRAPPAPVGAVVAPTGFEPALPP